MSDPRTLEVWCFGTRAGTLVDGPGASMTFDYDAAWPTRGMPPLSQSLPLDSPSTPRAAAAVFGGLLPEGMPRTLLARRLGTSVDNDFALLAAIGGDTAGAISIRAPGAPAPVDTGGVEWLDDAQLVDLVDELPTRPMRADADGDYRLSLAGAQDKLPVVLGPDGRIGLTKGDTPSTHILKTPIQRLDDTVANEALCPAFGRRLGVDTVAAVPHRVGDRSFLLVTRYDREPDAESGRVRRLHQEDFCQALGIPTPRKYQADGGPSSADCFALVRHATQIPAPEVGKLLDAFALSFLVGNHDAHGKNYSLLYRPDDARAVLAPVYDVLSTFAYRKSHGLSRKMAMSIGGEYRPDYVRPRHLDRMLGDAHLGAATARRRLRALAAAAPAAVRDARAELVAAGWDAPVLGRIVEIVDQRADRLDELTAPARRAALVSR